MSKVLVDEKLLHQIILHFEMDGPEWERYDILEALRLVISKNSPPVTKTGPDGWTEWYGGQCPVRPTVWVEIRVRNGSVGTGLAGAFDWEHDDQHIQSDIIAYRVLPNLAQSTSTDVTE